MPLNCLFDVRKELDLIRSPDGALPACEPGKPKALEYLECLFNDFKTQAQQLAEDFGKAVGSSDVLDIKTTLRIEDDAWDVASIETAVELGQRSGKSWEYFIEKLQLFEKWYQNRELATH